MDRPLKCRSRFHRGAGNELVMAIQINVMDYKRPLNIG